MIVYKQDVIPTLGQVIELYQSAGLNRPVHDEARIAKMYEHANLVITAWDGDALVGVARSLTDFCYCCYLSDLAVNAGYQKAGVGSKLIGLTRNTIGQQTTLILLSAPGAMEYYPKQGFEKINNGFIINRKS